jgi:hypothetical protein
MSDLKQRSQTNSPTENLEFNRDVLHNSTPTSQCVSDALRPLMSPAQSFPVRAIEAARICLLLAHVADASTITISEDVAMEELVAIDYSTT